MTAREKLAEFVKGHLEGSAYSTRHLNGMLETLADLLDAFALEAGTVWMVEVDRGKQLGPFCSAQAAQDKAKREAYFNRASVRVVRCTPDGKREVVE